MQAYFRLCHILHAVARGRFARSMLLPIISVRHWKLSHHEDVWLWRIGRQSSGRWSASAEDLWAIVTSPHHPAGYRRPPQCAYLSSRNRQHTNSKIIRVTISSRLPTANSIIIVALHAVGTNIYGEEYGER